MTARALSMILALGLLAACRSPDFPSVGAGAPPPASAAVDPLPQALQGRWGLGPKDCAAPPGSEGLLIVRPRGLNLHGTQAQLTAILDRGPMRAIADYAIVRNDRTWSRRIVLQGQPDGGLVRRDFDQWQLSGALRYIRCP